MGLGVILYSVARQTFDRKLGIMLIIKMWRNFAWEQPVIATVLATIPFIVLVLLGDKIDGTVDRGAMGDRMLVAIIVLYLALAVFVGLTTPLWVGSIGPVLAVVFLILLWPLIQGENYNSLTYDSGWVGGIIYSIVIPSSIIWLFVYVGYLIGRTGSKS